MVGIDDVVEILHLSVTRVLRTFPLGLEFYNVGGIGRRPVGVYLPLIHGTGN